MGNEILTCAGKEHREENLYERIFKLEILVHSMTKLLCKFWNQFSDGSNDSGNVEEWMLCGVQKLECYRDRISVKLAELKNIFLSLDENRSELTNGNENGNLIDRKLKKIKKIINEEEDSGERRMFFELKPKIEQFIDRSKVQVKVSILIGFEIIQESDWIFGCELEK